MAGHSSYLNSPVGVTLLKLACPDRVGLLSRITGFVASHRGNLLEVHQFTDPVSGWFFTRMAIDSKSLAIDLPELREAFRPIATELQADWTIRSERVKMRVAIMVSKLGHCLADLLWRWRSGELSIEIPVVISNHEDFRDMVEREGIRFEHLPIDPENKQAGFERLKGLFHEIQPDLTVLERQPTTAAEHLSLRN